jgi:hypothetical protein
MISADERRERSRIGAYETLSRHDPHTVTEAARAATWAKYERQVDPRGELDAEERHRRARHAMRADLARLNLRRLQAQRRAQEEAQQAADVAVVEQLATGVPGGTGHAN